MESTLELPDIFFLSAFFDLEEVEDDDADVDDASLPEGAGGGSEASEGTDSLAAPLPDACCCCCCCCCCPPTPAEAKADVSDKLRRDVDDDAVAPLSFFDPVLICNCCWHCVRRRV